MFEVTTVELLGRRAQALYPAGACFLTQLELHTQKLWAFDVCTDGPESSTRLVLYPYGDIDYKILFVYFSFVIIGEL